MIAVRMAVSRRHQRSHRPRARAPREGRVGGGGAVLVVVGLLLVTGARTEIMQWLRSWLAATGFGESAL